MLNYFE